MDPNEQLNKILAMMTAMTAAMSSASGNANNFNKVMAEATRLGKRYQELSEKDLKLIQAKIEADEEYAKQIEAGTKKIKDGGLGLVKTLADTAKQLGSMSNAVASSDQSFTAMLPVVNMMGSIAKGVTEAMGKMLSGITILGTGTGRASEGLAQLAGVGIDLVTGAMTQQLESAQKLVNSYQMMSKAGVTFGGNLDKMAHAAHNGGMNIDEFSKFVTKNISSLSAIGGSATEGAQRVTGLSNSILKTDQRLLAMYGSYDELNSATADYMGELARYGNTMKKDDKSLAQGAQDYLYNMKMLSDITGQNADTIKKEEEERARSAAYQRELSMMSEKEQNNVKTMMTMYGKMYGDAGKKYVMELVSTHGHVASKGGLMFESVYKQGADLAKRNYAIRDQESAEYNKALAGNIQNTYENRRAEVENNKQLFTLQAQGVKNDFIDVVGSGASAFYSSSNMQADMIKNMSKSEEDRGKKMDAGTQVYVDTIKSLNEFKIKMDKLTMDNLPKMGEMMNNLYKIASASAEMLKHMEGAANLITGQFAKATVALVNAINKVTGKDGEESTLDTIKGYWDAIDLKKAGGAALAGGAATAWSGLGAGVGAAFMGGGSILSDIAMHAYKQHNKPSAVVGGGAEQAQGLNLKVRPTGDVTQGGLVKENLVQAAQLLQTSLGEHFGFITSLNDNFHHGLGKSDHTEGLAMDFTTNPAPKDAKEAAAMKQQIIDLLTSKNLKPRWVGDEYFADKTGNTTGGHFHVSMPKMAKGGITNGTSIAGEAGPEAVIPLPDGRTIPVKMDMSEMMDVFKEMLEVLKDHKDISDKHRKAVV